MADMTRIQELCAEYLGGIWEQFCDEIKVETIETGFANKTYRCSLNNSEQNDVIVKIFGSELTANVSLKLQGIAGEVIVFHRLSLIGIAPKLLAAFDNGRIEEFVKGRNVTNEDLFRDHSLLSLVAKIMVKYHCQSMPVSKQINYIDKIVKPLSEINLEKSLEEFPEKDRFHIQNLYNFPMETEIDWITKFAPRINSKVVFSHHDIRPDNIIHRDSFEDNKDRLVLIDYEMSGYDYRGFDIGYFLSNLCFRISKSNQKISCEFEGELKPEIERYFIEEYLKELRQLDNCDNEFDTFEHLLMETKYFSLLVILVMMGYGRIFINTPNWSNQMESFAYITDVINDYYTKKSAFLTSNSNVFE